MHAILLLLLFISVFATVDGSEYTWRRICLKRKDETRVAYLRPIASDELDERFRRGALELGITAQKCKAANKQTCYECFNSISKGLVLQIKQHTFVDFDCESYCPERSEY
ncbi:unnamed protein product [Bursaphelenchus okinawaensis]|uniref:Uncharacterized protein n=1 Tax=Bursaphelenchus okinawaensis TaxID=465554 RepID=A0A811KSC3_9BILA|nr:unnamed protein product [Bursaphelenchus okinawaensis]CAG9109540.1 unnamed protein product [Bursaphelenchus okinawaensis]